MKRCWQAWILSLPEQETKKMRKDVKDALCISLVMVDQKTKFVHAIPVQSKEVTNYLVEEVCRVLMLMQPRTPNQRLR